MFFASCCVRNGPGIALWLNDNWKRVPYKTPRCAFCNAQSIDATVLVIKPGVGTEKVTPPALHTIQVASACDRDTNPPKCPGGTYRNQKLRGYILWTRPTTPQERALYW